MGLTAGKGRRVKQNPAKTQEDQEKKDPREVLQQKDYLCQFLQSGSPLSEGRWRCPLPETSPLPESPPSPEDSPLAPGGAARLLHKSTSRYQQRQVPMRASQRKVNHTLTLGAALEKSRRVRQGCLGRATCCRSGLVLDDDHRDLSSLCRSLGQSPEEEQVQSKANEIQDEQQELKNYKYSKRSLLFFFFLVGAERGEVEVRRAPGARRRRRSFPWPLGGSSGGGLRRPRSSCWRGVSSGRN